MHDAGAEFPAERTSGDDDSQVDGGARTQDGVGNRDGTRVTPTVLSTDRPATPKSRWRNSTRSWPERCEYLFEDLRRPARAMVSRAYGRALSDHELDDVYAAAWAATLSALRTRGEAMADDELRAYVLTAVASHASKELRRRSRKPTGSLDDAHEQVLFDVHAPLPDEQTIGRESGGVARDLLSSLPPRRRAVMLLRYGWGMSPKEVCRLVAGLSPRAYRKEVTRGVEQLIERLKLVESGEWCESREPILRDYVAGTADEETERQAVHHIRHCRACSNLVTRLSGQLHELGSALALAGGLGERRLSLVDRFAALVHRGKEATTSATENGESAFTSVATTGGARGSGAAGAGLITKIAALGTAGKAAVACVGAGAAATACVAAGVVPGVALPGRDRDISNRPVVARAHNQEQTSPTVPGLSPDTIVAVEGAHVSQNAALASEGGGSEEGVKQHATESVKTSPQGAPSDSVAPSAPPVEQEFGLAAASTTAPAPSSSSSSPPSSGGGTTSGAGASGSDISQEFGP